MRIFIFGQKSFGAAVLKRLIADGHTITGVAVPEAGQYYDKVHVLCVKERLKVFPVDKIVSSDIPDETELIVAAHSHHFISEKILERAGYGGIGYHPSALPRHRGRDAVRWTVAMKDPITAGTVYWLDSRVDGGDILSQRFIHVSRMEDHHALWRRLFDIGVGMLSTAVYDVSTGKAGREPQSNKYATWEPPFDPTARLHRPELLALSGTVDKPERNPSCAHGYWECPNGEPVCSPDCAWFNGHERK